ncbi:DUF3977 family protein [Paenibacillus radicis (ex Gao et al. 2016)]|uniref:DUF3977 domain-containing protein n=1 Tax=Paenibacillus radicis (ex Gao et al. 2016) TaxID=1737354 RepID=A0A917H689_9BACL|nr:DUF3977 family protein [Paenibacillus radicis (ex Gao et al. 2016)]GGG68730.1 hypothetical protein GCM10010918_24650 [Paenibacillus radicis (ex Gao et al. 2016)]
MKYIEVGIGNTWLVRTETELADGTEFEQKGIVRPIVFHSVYFRVWFGKTVFIWDSKEGLKRMNKTRSAFKLIFGVTSH